jgi:UDPglucose 6-dehydrogenase
MKITIVGSGYVGTTTGFCFASRGFKVNVVEKNPEIVRNLKNGVSSIFEPFLDELIGTATEASRVRFFSDCAGAVEDADLVFLTVGTPTDEVDGSADLSALWQAVREMAPHLRSGAVIVVKSTVPVGTNRGVVALLHELRPDLDFSVASNPEFLREGSAVRDFFHADRVVCGVSDQRARDRLLEAYRAIISAPTRLVFTTPESAELSKYASNAFLAMKVSFINEIADLCERAGADVGHVARIIGMDRRIGAEFLAAGPGYGGSCFPKDTRALASAAGRLNTSVRLVEAAIDANTRRKSQLANRIMKAIANGGSPKTVAALGIAFKANTDDIRDAPSLDLIPHLQAAGCKVHAHDPVCRAKAEPRLPGAVWFDDPIEAVRGADAAVILTDWDHYRQLDLRTLAAALGGRHLFDFRNIIDATAAEAAGLILHAIGRGSAGMPVRLETWSPDGSPTTEPVPLASQRSAHAANELRNGVGE